MRKLSIALGALALVSYSSSALGVSIDPTTYRDASSTTITLTHEIDKGDLNTTATLQFITDKKLDDWNVFIENTSNQDWADLVLVANRNVPVVGGTGPDATYQFSNAEGYASGGSPILTTVTRNAMLIDGVGRDGLKGDDGDLIFEAGETWFFSLSNYVSSSDLENEFRILANPAPTTHTPEPSAPILFSIGGILVGLAVRRATRLKPSQD